MHPLIVVQLTIKRSGLERLYDELSLLPKRARAGHLRYVLQLVSEGRYVTTPSFPSAAKDHGPIVVKLQFKPTDKEYAELDALGPSLRAGPLRTKLLLYCQGAVLMHGGPSESVAASDTRPLGGTNADEDIAQAFGLSASLTSA